MQLDLRSIRWGQLDAKKDYDADWHGFRAKHISVGDETAIDEPHHLFLWGGRGCGKTEFSLIHKDRAQNKDILVNIDFDATEPSWTTMLLTKLVQVIGIKGLSLPHLASHMWFESIWTQIMVEMALKGNLLHQLGRDNVTRYLRKRDPARADKRVFDRVISGIDLVVRTLSRHGGLTESPIAQGLSLTVTGLRLVEKCLTSSADFAAARRAVYDSLKPRGDVRVFVLVDSVDKWLPPRSHSDSDRDYMILAEVIRGLMTCLVHLHEDPPLRQHLSVKAFLPLDLNEFVRDRTYEHNLVYHHTIRWRAFDLANLIVRRIWAGGLHQYERERVLPDLDNTWYQLFDHKVRNSRTGAEHDSFDYVLRHTMFRPRQLLAFCRLASEEAKTANVTRMNASMIKQTVHRHCDKMAQFFLDEFGYRFAINDVMGSLQKSTNVLTPDQLRNKLKHVPRLPWMSSGNDMVQFLYDIGVIGVVQNVGKVSPAMHQGTMRTVVDHDLHLFLFKHTHEDECVTHHERYVIHPLFYDGMYCEINPDLTVGHLVL